MISFLSWDNFFEFINKGKGSTYMFNINIKLVWKISWMRHPIFRLIYHSHSVSIEQGYYGSTEWRLRDLVVEGVVIYKAPPPPCLHMVLSTRRCFRRSPRPFTLKERQRRRRDTFAHKVAICIPSEFLSKLSRLWVQVKWINIID